MTIDLRIVNAKGKVICSAATEECKLCVNQHPHKGSDRWSYCYRKNKKIQFVKIN